MRSTKEVLTLSLLAATAVGAAFGGYTTVRALGESRINGIVAIAYAQEAQADSYKMDFLMQKAREDDDEKKIKVCEETKSEGRCALESEHRWDMWRWTDCTQAGGDLQMCGPKPELRL